MTAEEPIRISLEKLRKFKRVEHHIADPILWIAFEIKYRNLGGLPYYEVNYDPENECDGESVCANNIVDIVEDIRKKYDVVIVP
jgi:hypothetical protein